MNVLAKTLGFSVFLIFAFASVTYVLPQMKGEAPEEVELDVGSLTMAEFTAMGETLFTGKGTCTLCHNNLGRAPDFAAINVSETSLERLQDARYQGKATDAESYLRESMVDPSIYVVAGFGKKGSDDSESPMPAVDKPPISLSSVEMDAIIAYLQNKDGNPITVALPSEAPAKAAEDAPASAPAAEVASLDPPGLITKFGCATCHSILGTESPVGPSLNDIGARRSVAEIRESIVSPKAVIADGFPPIMPDFPAMTLQELELIVRFLADQSGNRS